MEHILTECNFSGQHPIWKMAEKLWSHTGRPWTTPSLGLIIGSGLNMFTDDEGRVDSGLCCLYTIIMSEIPGGKVPGGNLEASPDTHLIWKTRNEWRIGTQGDPSKLPKPGELMNRWLTILN
ncbi:hypothetical protein M422DRAFT_145043, partial [Sphaerobolus stellatus SS14]